MSHRRGNPRKRLMPDAAAAVDQFGVEKLAAIYLEAKRIGDGDAPRGLEAMLARARRIRPEDAIGEHVLRFIDGLAGFDAAGLLVQDGLQELPALVRLLARGEISPEDARRLILAAVQHRGRVLTGPMPAQPARGT